jgi:hypothetical protein
LAAERFGDADWRARPEVARWLFAAYPRMRQVQEWLAQLSLAATVSGSAGLQALAAELEGQAPHWPDWSAAEQAAWQARVQAALAPLAGQRNSRS